MTEDLTGRIPTHYHAVTTGGVVGVQVVSNKEHPWLVPVRIHGQESITMLTTSALFSNPHDAEDHLAARVQQHREQPATLNTEGRPVATVDKYDLILDETLTAAPAAKINTPQPYACPREDRYCPINFNGMKECIICGVFLGGSKAIAAQKV